MQEVTISVLAGVEGIMSDKSQRNKGAAVCFMVTVGLLLLFFRLFFLERANGVVLGYQWH